MIINIDDSEKVSIIHAISVAVNRMNSCLATAFDNCHPDLRSMDWYSKAEDYIRVMKELKKLLDMIEETKGETK